MVRDSVSVSRPRLVTFDAWPHFDWDEHFRDGAASRSRVRSHNVAATVYSGHGDSPVPGPQAARVARQVAVLVAPDGARPSDTVKRYDVGLVLAEPWTEPPRGDVSYRSVTRRAAYYLDPAKAKLGDEMADAICDQLAAIGAAFRRCRDRTRLALGLRVDEAQLPVP